MKTKTILVTLAMMLALAGGAIAQEGRLQERLLGTAEGLQTPSSESDSGWTFVSYPDEKELPTAERFQQISGCPVGPGGGTSRLDFDATLDSLGDVEPWMDKGQKRSARGFRKLQRVFHRELGDDLAVYRCETGGPEVHIHFIGASEAGERLAGLVTVSIET